MSVTGSRPPLIPDYACVIEGTLPVEVGAGSVRGWVPIHELATKARPAWRLPLSQNIFHEHSH